tara:strand:- start:81 stop:287 length:207 start_codon:yes stop_codon:yes gene_type:complete
MKLIVIYYVEVDENHDPYGSECSVDVDHGIVGVYKDDDSEITAAIMAKYSSDEYNFEYITLGQINYNS